MGAVGGWISTNNIYRHTSRCSKLFLYVLMMKKSSEGLEISAGECYCRE